MKKKLLIVGITVVLITVGLSGCTDQKSVSDSDKFVGTWIQIMEVPGEYEGEAIETIEVNYVFKSDGTYTAIPEPGPQSDGTWKVEDGKFLMTSVTASADMLFDYSFSDGGNVLTLEMMGLTMVLNKQ